MTNIELTLTVEEVNVVLAALGERPFAEVYQLITKIQEQAQAQLEDGEVQAPVAFPDDD